MQGYRYRRDDVEPPPLERELPELKPPPELPMLLPEREVVDIVERYELDAFCEKLDELLDEEELRDEEPERYDELEDLLDEPDETLLPPRRVEVLPPVTFDDELLPDDTFDEPVEELLRLDDVP